MISLKEVLFLLWFATCAKALCSNATICITNGDDGESQCQQNHQIFHTLSDLTINQTSCETVHIYLTSGTHILSRNLDFSNSVQETVICGASQGPPSIIECQGETGIEFSENASVKVEMVELLHCNRTRNIQRTVQATLFFKNAQYTLSGVTVKNTEGWGVYAEDCWEQIIFNCTFINNKGNIAIRGTAPIGIQIEINNTMICDGKESDPSIADCNGIDVHLRNIMNLTFRIINCDLQRNQGGHFHLYIHNYITCNDFTILIDNSTFNTSDDYGVGMQFTCYRYNNIDVTLRRSRFSKNNKSGLFLNDITHSKIEDCIFDSNRENGVEVKKLDSDNYHLSAEISNTTFSNNSRSPSQAALFFENAQYTLSGVTVKNTEGWGIYAEDCSDQIIIDCTFINNKGNIAIRGTAPVVLVEINNTKIHDGKQSYQSIADCNGVDVHLRNILNFTFRIINCDLQRNQGGHFHLLIHNYITPKNFKILIDSSTFNTSEDHGVGMQFICYRYSDIDVTLRKSRFSKNNKSGLFLIDTPHSKIEDCIFESNGENGVEVRNYNNDNHSWNEIFNTTFVNNSRTLQAALFFKDAQYTLSDVTVKNTEGWGVYAEDCWEQIIFNCTFINNKGNIDIRGTAQVVLVEINNTKIHDGKQSDLSIADCYGVDVHLKNSENFTFRIINCDYQRNQGGHFHLYIRNDITPKNFTIFIDNSTFNTSDDYGGVMQFICDEYTNIIPVTIQRSNFSKNDKSGLFLVDTTHSKIEDCLFNSNMENGVEVVSQSIGKNWWTVINLISNTTFINNSRAISLINLWLNSTNTKISECKFIDHIGNDVVAIGNRYITGTVTIENSSFQGNRKLYRGDKNCSILYIELQRNITLSDVSITDNNCTGIKLIHSTMKLENLVTLSGNHGQNGGGLYLSMSKLIFSTSSKLNIINNSADAYGGGIYIEEETCTSDNTCFFQLEEEYPSISSQVIAFSGNHAEEGGDQMLGGCLSHCSIQLNKKKNYLSMCELNNLFWDIVSANTTFMGYRKRLTFCKNSEDSSASDYSCSYSKSIHAYRGQMFNVSLMIADDCCFPISVDNIEAEIKTKYNKESPLQFKQKKPVFKSEKICSNYSYALKGGIGLSTPATIEFSIEKLSTAPAILTVNLEECPIGYNLSKSGECVCHDILKSHNVKCTPSKKLLHIPAQTWLGELWNESESIAVQNNCQYCKTKEMELIVPIDSNKLCNYNRTGIMCGACVSNYSLLLGGYECADCSGSTYKGVLLFLAFLAIGKVLVILLLGLDLTVSTGIVNGLIFYSDIIYLNSDTMLPITRGENRTHLLNTVRILSTFQAWMNLDFGISTCFFDGYNTYISTWMQFLFPLYIWLLILIIILTSRYSRRITKIITSNIVSVLATLLLLSYAKLLKTSIEVFSLVPLQLLNGNVTNRWKSDANIRYLGQLHVPLFLMSLAMVLVYMIPFTLLILLGPLLQAKSHYRVLHWINRLKPFHDAFYGPYTSKYRYWPGILLLARLLILGAFASYSPNDVPFQLLAVSMTAAALLVLWMVIGRANANSLYQSNYLNYLELYFLTNLLAFASLSIYTTKFSHSKTENQQVLAVVMVGSVLAVSCGIIGYKMFCIAIKYRAVHNISRLLPANCKEKSQNSTEEQEEISTKITHSLVELTECKTPNNELREPLLASQVHES